MTLQEHNEKILKGLSALVSQNEPLYKGVTTMNVDRQKRIFDEGKNSAGGKIGSYSTKLMLATKGQFVSKTAFKPTMIKQKNGKSKMLFIKFPNAKKAVPVMALPGGYKQFKSINGRRSDFVNLHLYGNLRSDFPKVAKLSVNQYITGPFKPENQTKLSALQKKYGSIAQHTKEERARLLDIILKETIATLNA
jgi:hypothetical protein